MSARRTFRIAAEGFARNYPSEQRAYEAARALLTNSPLVEKVTVTVREAGSECWLPYEKLTRQDFPVMTWQEIKEAYDTAAGRPVQVYYHGGLRPEGGVISSINATYVFVRFSDGVKACYPRDLTLGT